jgi:hypothetical protein
LKYRANLFLFFFSKHFPQSFLSFSETLFLI